MENKGNAKDIDSIIQMLSNKFTNKQSEMVEGANDELEKELKWYRAKNKATAVL